MCYIDGDVIDYAKWCHIKYRWRGQMTDGDTARDNHLLSVTSWPVRAVTRGATDHPDVTRWAETNGHNSSQNCFIAPGFNCRWPMFVTDTRPTPANKYLLRQNTNSKIGKIPHTPALSELSWHQQVAIFISPGVRVGALTNFDILHRDPSWELVKYSVIDTGM